MTNKNILRKLASLTINGSGKINKEIASYTLSSLSRKELSLYLKALKRIISERFVIVYHGDDMSEKLKSELNKKFKDTPPLYQKTALIKNGIKISHNDTVVDLSVGGYIDNIVQGLKK